MTFSVNAGTYAEKPDRLARIEELLKVVIDRLDHVEGDLSGAGGMRLSRPKIMDQWNQSRGRD